MFLWVVQLEIEESEVEEMQRLCEHKELHFGYTELFVSVKL